MLKRVLRVYANPYTFIDPEGRPAGVYSYDPARLPGQQHVGIARLQTTVTEPRDPSKDPRPSLMDLVHHYDAEIQEISYTPGDPGFKHYRDGIREGSLIPADEATAKAVGLPFEDPNEVLGRARLKAVRDWQDAHDGEAPAFASDDNAHAHVPTALRGPANAQASEPPQAPQPQSADPRRGEFGTFAEAVAHVAAALPTDEPTDDAARDAQATEKGDR
jgi:hypothetical protein